MTDKRIPAMIAAVGPGLALGRKGDLIWHISADLKNFKRLTTGHPVIMGRKTWESLPKRPLPGRLNIVMTRSLKALDGALTVSSIDDALKTCEGLEKPMVMGGAEIYRMFMPVADILHITNVCAEPPEDTDTWFPEFHDDFHLSEAGEWETDPNGTKYRFETWTRVKD